MKTLILPGYSEHNRDWAEEVAKNLMPSAKSNITKSGKKRSQIIVHVWDHWSKGGSLNINSEVEKILVEVGKEKVNFIAKSVGTKVLMSVVPRIKEQINKVILCGIPIDPVGYAKVLKQIGYDNLVIFQNSQDPFMPYKAIKLYIKAVDKNIKVIEKPRFDHSYPYYYDFKLFLKGKS
ncbi:hypothetical protein A3A76_02475 [Candidatus Woesebacteria bacterium RIFCSPLOWO2_01_FULL_39_23]|uniref:Alpha/beta hydrolase n=1 Tax=Candidatus Woesebacteria bacterium RIFCSPHIGHO2_01_FULL_40_22 TaxID=1802499 RepID=A0A1F7YJA2_9BACT|nr:MAG: hypothetical protein A2628_00880 [Candidatus Woesebacteria bacterium RIFCSPHIGHO2_01_FULL_40_22]OGM36961.1 MAG: hypothetical protein A3E41_05810 [Candidatus Woesebacteria bacterium RIFCSPHIGHO2_12_FULL_38_9]OGM62514.1 MAG: hypothetical protein A3A76_02475 [Candidatus Woesebacteria bacterium RIFCSPLOWO2_01_FULL_39_23]